MQSARTRRPRDPEATREVILAAAGAKLAQDGPEGLSLSEVAALAGVNRGTAYQHFESREKLIKATTEWVAEKMFRAVYGDPNEHGDRPVEEADVPGLTDRLSAFAMANAELCRAWLLQVLASPDPWSDIFFREYQVSIAKFAETDLAVKGIDTEVFSVMMLAGICMWPVWAHAHSETEEDQQKQSRRFSNEMLRLTMFGTMRSTCYPEIIDRLVKERSVLKSLSKTKIAE